MKLKNIISLVMVLTLVFTFVACGNQDDPKGSTVEKGILTVATGDPAWEPWVMGDKPESGKGFEAALVYAIAEKMGIEKENVKWVRTGFDEAITPGQKDWDFNVQQYTITDERKKQVDFAGPYYNNGMVVISKKGNPYAKAESIADLKGAQIGVASGDIALDYANDVIKPSLTPKTYNNLADAAQALNRDQIDAVVVDDVQGYYIVNIASGEGDDVQVENGVILGTLPELKDDEGSAISLGYGALLSKGNKLTPVIQKAIDELKEDGTIDKLIKEYLGDYTFPELK